MLIYNNYIPMKNEYKFYNNLKLTWFQKIMLAILGHINNISYYKYTLYTTLKKEGIKEEDCH